MKRRRNKALERQLEKVHSFRDAMAALSDEELQAKTPEFKQRLADG